jgi:NADH dehydrogenase
LQPVYVEDVAEAVAQLIRRPETPSTIFEFGGPCVYSYQQLVRAVGHQAGLAPLLIPIPFSVWHALAWVSKILPQPALTRNQVELMQIDTVTSPEMPDLPNLELRRS